MLSRMADDGRRVEGQGRKRLSVFYAVAVVVLAVSGFLGYSVRPDLVGVFLGWLVACLPVACFMIAVGLYASRRDAQTRDE
jgi:F0F1-type ATP synthase assembly protein I